jgi:MFS family permease
MSVSKADTVLVVGFLILVQGTGALAGFWLPAIAPEIGNSLGLSPSLIAYPVLILYIFAMISSLMAGGLVARFGAWRSSQAALILIAISHFMFMHGSIPLIVTGSIVLGCAYGLLTPPASHLLSKIVTPTNRNLVFSIRFTGVPLGGIIAGLAGPSIALQFGWQESMLVTILVAVTLTILMQPLREKWDNDRSKSAKLIRNPISDIKLVWNLTALRWVALSGLCMGAIQTTLTTYTVTMLVEDLSYTLVAAGIGLSAIQFASVLGRLGWGWFADRLQNGLIILMAIAIIAACCALTTIFLSSDWPQLLVYSLCFIFGLVGMGWNGVYAGEIARLSPPGEVGRATGASFFITFSGVFFGPVIFASTYSLTETYSSTFLTTAVIALFGCLCIFNAKRALLR